MSESKKLFRGAVVLTSGQVASYALSFLRNVILARMLTKADFGLAAVFGMTLSLLEVAGRMSFGQQIIQSKEGGSESFVASSNALQFILAIVGAVLVVSLSHPLAQVFKVPQLVWAFALLGMVPLARCFENLDYFRQQRQLNYLPAVLCDLIPQMVVTLATWPLALWLGDFRVIVWLMVGKAVLGNLMTHVVARQPYRWAWRWDYIRVMLLFGWPLLLNALLMFASQQADQVVVGAFLSLNELASYALVLSVVSIPWFIFGQVGTSLMLPILSRVQDDPERFRQQYRTCVEYAGVGAVLLTIPLIVSGEQLVTFLFGAKYQGAGNLMAILGAASAVRFLRFVPAVAAMARADTLNQLFSNVWRSLSLPLALAVALLSGGVVLIAGCVLLAEITATAFSLLRLSRFQGVPLRDTAGAAVYVFGFLAVELALAYVCAPRLGYGLAAAGLFIFLALSLLVARVAFPAVIRTLMDATRQTRLAPVKSTASN